ARTISGPTTIRGGAGDDHILVNYTSALAQTYVEAIAATLTLAGGDDGDTYDVGLVGNVSATINVFDGGSGGTDTLRLWGTNGADYWTNTGAVVDALQVNGTTLVPVPGGSDERVTYDAALERVQL